jgi:hypothetical protein
MGLAGEDGMIGDPGKIIRTLLYISNLFQVIMVSPLLIAHQIAEFLIFWLPHTKAQNTSG